MASDFTPLVNVVVDELPAVIGALQAAFSRKHPDQPTPTSEEVLAAFNTIYQTSLEKDEEWLAAHQLDPSLPSQ